MGLGSGSWVKCPSAAGKYSEGGFFLQRRGSPGVWGHAGSCLPSGGGYFSFVVVVLALGYIFLVFLFVYFLPFQN